jgi:hypothetical protein
VKEIHVFPVVVMLLQSGDNPEKENMVEVVEDLKNQWARNVKIYLNFPGIV